MIEVEMPDGVIVEFPDGTDDETIRRALSGVRSSAAPPPPKSRSWGAEIASLASQAIPGASLFAPPATGLTAQFQQGLTMGWGDELNAGLAGAKAMLPGGQSPADAYNAAMQQQQAERELYERSNPGRAFAGEVAGGLLGAGKIGGAVKAGSAVAAVPRMAATGAAAGAFAGAGSADPNDRMDGAVTGGMLGAAAGPMLQGAARLFRDGKKLVGNALMPSAGAADEAVVGAMTRDGRTLKEWQDALLQAPKGVPVSAADTASPGVQSLLSGAAVVPGKAQQVVMETFDKRLGEQGQRVREAVQQSAGPRQYAVDLVEEIKSTRWAKAGPLYDKAFASGRVDDKRIAEILKKGAFADAYKRAQSIADTEGIQLAPLDAPDLRTLDYVKRGMDDHIDAGFRGGSLGKAEAASLKKLRAEMLSIMDAKSPDYARARQVYSGDSEVLEAIETGRKALNMGDGQLAMTLKKMKPAEREAFRKAALDALNDKMNSKEGAGLITDLIGNEKARRNLKLIVGNPEQYAALSKRLLAEKAIRDTGGRVNPKVGSATAMRQGDAGALPESANMLQNLASGNKWALVTQGIRALQMRGQGLNDTARGRMASDLMSDDKAVQAAYLKRLADAQKRMEAARKKRGFLGESTAGGAVAGLLSD